MAAAQGLASTVIILLLPVTPWLNPFAPGPSPAVLPLLFSWACTATVFGLCVCRTTAITPARLVAVVSGSWVLAGLTSSGIGLLQYVGAASDSARWLNLTEPGEAFANLRQRNQFATLTNIALLALLWWAWRVPRGAWILSSAVGVSAFCRLWSMWCRHRVQGCYR